MDDILRVFDKLSFEIFKLDNLTYEEDVYKIVEYCDELGRLLEDLAIDLNEEE